MSLPQEIKEELLSAYLDDALRGDERRCVEQMLAHDEEARLLWEQLSSLQQTTRAALQGSASAPSDLAHRVLAEAQQRADEEALPATHHVRLADSGRDGTPRRSAASRSRWHSLAHWQPLGVVIGLAAALLLAVTLWQNPFGGSEQGPAVARSEVSPDPSSTPSSGPDLAEKPPSGDSPSAAPSTPPAGMVARAEADAAARQAGSPDVDGSPTATERATPEPDPARLADASPAAGSAGSAAMRSAPSAKDPAAPDPAAQLAAQAVMMFEVEQTDRGRENRAVFQAMQAAGIRANGTQAVNEAVVGYLQDAELVGGPPQAAEGPADSRPVSIVFVEASGKQLDRFMVSLFANTDEIGRIGWNLAMDVPVVAATHAIGEAVPTDVRSTEAAGAAWEIVSSDAEGRFPAAAADRPFLPIDRRDPEAWQGAGSASLGADIRSRLLILIR